MCLALRSSPWDEPDPEFQELELESRLNAEGDRTTLVPGAVFVPIGNGGKI